MDFYQKFKHTFSHLPLLVGGLTGFLLVIIASQLFIRSCGGPFPDRTRGPFARYEHYKLGEMPEWENALKMTDQGKTTSEILLEGQQAKLPRLQFGEPPQSATQTVK
jgi:hypothetical protein